MAKNEVVTEIEGGLLIQLDGSITDRDGNPVSKSDAEKAQDEAKAQAEAEAEAAKVANSTPPALAGRVTGRR